MALKPEERVMLLAPIVRGRKGEFKKELEKLAQQGFTRARIDGELRSLDGSDESFEDIKLDKRKNHTIEVVVDRLLIKAGIEKRLENSVATGMRLADGLVQVVVVGGDEQLYSAKMACPDCGINIPVLEPRSFSFNSLYGACPECQGDSAINCRERREVGVMGKDGGYASYLVTHARYAHKLPADVGLAQHLDERLDDGIGGHFDLLINHAGFRAVDADALDHQVTALAQAKRGVQIGKFG